jgi:hypothetical protein
MKTWDSWARVVKFAGVTVVVSSFLLLANFRGRATRFERAGRRVSSAAADGASRLPSAKERPRLMEAYSNLPLSFEENQGQKAQEVRYVSRGAGYELFLASQEAVLALRAPISHDLSPRHRFATLRAIREASRARTMSVVRMRFEGANPRAQISATDRLLKRTNYFIGNDPRKWHTDVPSYARVKYAGIYPGVDLVFYGNQRRLEYDFIVAPGADPKSIRLSLGGSERLRVDAHGDLVLSVSGGEVVLQKPVVYQMLKGERHEIEGNYVLEKGHQVTFSVAAYDRSEPLVLDPVLNYSSYLGGTSDDQGLGIAVDSAGDAFVAGTTFSTDFPTTANASNQGPLAGNLSGEAFVTEMNPTGTAEIYSTYLAGSIGESAFALALDSTGKIYLTGQTLSSDFPTTSNALKQQPNAGNLNVGTSFITKLDPTQSGANQLVYSSYLGGTNGTGLAGGDAGQGIAVDANGIAYVVGYTDSTASTTVTSLPNFPIVNGFQTTLNSTNGNAFLAKIDTTKSGSNSLIYSTCMGGGGQNAGAIPPARLLFGDAAFGVAIDTTGNAYITGATSSTDFPTNGSVAAFQTAVHAGNIQGTAFVTKIDTTKTGSASLIYSTYLGGEIFEEGFAIALGPNNVAYVTGTTDSLLYPTMPAGAFQTTGHTSGNAFVSLIDTGKSGSASLTYSTYLGGSKGDTGNAIKVDSQGNAYVAGATSSDSDFPLTPGALQPAYPGAKADGFVSKLNPGGNGTADLLYSTYFGGSGCNAIVNCVSQDEADAIALDTTTPPNAYITGATYSAANFPVFPNPGAFQTSLNGAGSGTSDAFVAKLTLIPTLVVTPTSLNFGTVLIPNTSAPQSVTLTNNTNAAIAFTSAAISGGSPAAANTDYVISANTCLGGIPSGVPPANQCTISVTFKPSVVGAETATLVLTDGDSTSPQNVSLRGTGSASAPAVGLSAASLAFGGQLLTTTSAAKTVTLTNTGNATLTINSIAASGDFAISNNPCGASLAAGANCIISVTFAPTAVGARAGTLTITDNAGGSPHTAALAGTGWDFSVAATTPAAVKAGNSVNFTVTMTPLGGFNQAVALACTGAPALSTCTPAPASVTAADGVTPQTSTVTVTTTALVVPPSRVPTPPASMRQVVPLVLALMLFFLLFTTRRHRTRLGMVTAILLLVALAGCSRQKQPGTPTGQSTLTITTTSGSVSKTAKVTLTVN